MKYWQTCRKRKGRLEGKSEGETREDTEEKVCAGFFLFPPVPWVRGQK